MGSQSSYFYNPSREDTKKELEKLLNIVEHRLGGFRPIVIVGVADIVLWILKSDHRFSTLIHKRVEVEKLLNPIADQLFEQMLLIAERITDYLTNHSTTHPYRFVGHDDRPITTMEDIVAYNLLIQAYDDGQPIQIDHHRKKAFDMVLILKDQSIQPIDAQRQMIGNLLSQISNRVDYDLLVFIVCKLFPDFVPRWDSLAFSVTPAKISTNPPSTLEGSGSSGEGKDRKCCDLGLLLAISKLVFRPWIFNGSGSGEGHEGEKVIDTLRIFTLAAPEDNVRVLGFGKISNMSPYSCVRTIDDERDTWSGGFEESENELRSLGALRRRDLHDHDQRRKGNGKGDHAKEKMKNEGERSSSVVHLLKSIFRR